MQYFPQTFSGPRTTPARVAHLIQFGGDADVLEVHLNEIYEIVDKFFILESVRTHYKNMSKELVWPILAQQPRFKKFLDKIVYFPVNDSLLASMVLDYDGIWKNEHSQEKLRWKLFLQWNKEHNNYFKDDDVIGFGDTDEIAWAQNVLLLKNCQQKGVTDVGIWFTFGNLNKKMRGKWFFLRNSPFAYGDPTYFLLKDAKTFPGFPNRNRGRSPYNLVGGLHMTLYQYLPTILLKLHIMTEYDAFSRMKTLYKFIGKGDDIDQLQKHFSEFLSKDYPGRDDHVTNLAPGDLGKPPFIIPWYLKCNLNRFSTMTGHPIHDKRLDAKV